MKSFDRPAPAGLRHVLRLAALILVLVLVGAIAGCGGTLQLQPVKVPVPVECQETEPERPAMPTDLLSRADSLDRKAAAALAEIDVREGYEERLRVALRACKSPIKAAAPAAAVDRPTENR
jgi:predicted small lipoprotein YifL